MAVVPTCLQDCIDVREEKSFGLVVCKRQCSLFYAEYRKWRIVAIWDKGKMEKKKKIEKIVEKLCAKEVNVQMNQIFLKFQFSDGFMVPKYFQIVQTKPH